MTEEDKQLLFKDLSARLPYGVKIQISEKFPEWFVKEYGEGTTITPFTLDASIMYFIVININSDVKEVKPYLRSMSSMTKEEKEEYNKTKNKIAVQWDDYGTPIGYEYTYTIKTFDWLLTHHFDFRNLIRKGLALEAPDNMYKTE